jgi:transcriptional regulator with XRE-family HTH domain
MSKKSVGNQEALREMLHFFLDKMGATQVELSEGMGVSRPVVIDFLNKEKERLPVDREGLIKLCHNLQKSRASKRKLKTESQESSKQIVSNPDELRKLLGEVGPDELLESAGFLPKNTSVIRVSQERFFQIAQLVALLELLEFEDLQSTTQEFLAIASNKIAIASKKLFLQHPEYENDSLGQLINNLQKSHPTLGLKLRLEVIEKLRQAWERLKAGGKTKFTRQEAIALFLSVTIKEQMLKYPDNLDIRVKKLEFQTLSRFINQEEEYSDVYHLLTQIGYQAERNLNTFLAYSTTELEAQSLDSLRPVIKALVTCSFNYDGRHNDLEWSYTSNNTMVENAISACSLHMGLTKEVANVTLSTKTLDSSMNSLVETTVILGGEQKYQGIWVDRDSMTTMLQAIVCAVKQWLADQNQKGELNLEIYGSACEALSELKKRLTRAREAFHNFQFLDKECQSVEINWIANTARDELRKIPDKIYFSHRLNFYRCYFMAKILELRLANFQGNISRVELLIQEVEKVLDEDQEVKKELVPIRVLIQSEVYLYKLSSGHEPNLFEFSKRSKWLGLEEWDNKIRDGVKLGSCYKDPGLDVYQALSEIYGNIARIEFYLSNDKKTLEEAAVYFLKAAHYALRIGLTQRMARWLALAGRVWVRLGDGNLSKQALIFAEKIAKADLTSGHSNNFRQAVLSEIYILDGEYLLLIEDEPTKALERFLEALKGSVYLGLNRRICDALFNISRCSTKLSNFSIKEGLSRVFKEDEQLVEFNKSKLNPMSNHTSEKVLDLLCRLWNGEDNPTWFQVRGEFSRLAAQTWQGWHRDTASPGATTKHPISERIESESWLIQLT